MSEQDLARYKSYFIALSKPTAQRTLRFWMVRTTTAANHDANVASSPSGPTKGAVATATDEGRFSTRLRSGEDRRSGVDTRSDEERALSGERRSRDRRSIGNADLSPKTGDKIY